MRGAALKLGPVTSLVAFALAVPTAAAAPGDTCLEATEIAALPFSSSGTTCGAGNDFTNDAAGVAVCPDLPRGYGGEDVFFKLTLETGNQVAFDLALPPGATGDLALFLVRAPSCADPQVCAATSVDLIGAGVGPERIKTNTQAYPSGTYYLIVDSKLAAPDPASCGAYALTVSGHLSAFCGNGTVDPGEVCDDGNARDGDCCSADCQSKAATTTVCRAAADLCDAAETCNADGTCPANILRPAGTSCRPSAGVCDLAEVCDGVSATCPPDRLFAAGTPCRPARNLCDQTESCTGTQPDCPADAVKPVGTTCGPASTCDKAPICNASAICVPGGPVGCDDGNPCTTDMCLPAFGCLHTPSCQDAGADAGSDAGVDATAVDAAPDMNLPPPDAVAPDVNGPMLVPDAPVAGGDARDGPAGSLVDSAPSGIDSGPTPADGGDGIARDSSLGGATEVQSLPPGSSDQDAGNPGFATDGGADQPGQAGPKEPPGIAFPDGGGRMSIASQGACSCTLGARSGAGDGALAGLMSLTLLVLLVLRRRTT